ncbi:MAG: protein kinase, partial [Myxococcales bacterium]|nr:protein kinase [Myxococcales bacterium]
MSSTHSNQDNVDATLPDPPGAAASSAPAPAPERKPFRIGPYAVLGQIGRGAMGMVYAAYDEKLDRKVALKLLHSLQDTGTLGPARLLREAQSLARVSHPNVVQVFEVGQHDDEVFIAMEFVRGVTLRSWLTPASNGRPRGWREVLGIYLQAGRGLAAAHPPPPGHPRVKPPHHKNSHHSTRRGRRGRPLNGCGGGSRRAAPRRRGGPPRGRVRPGDRCPAPRATR